MSDSESGLALRQENEAYLIRQKLRDGLLVLVGVGQVNPPDAIENGVRRTATWEEVRQAKLLSLIPEIEDNNIDAALDQAEKDDVPAPTTFEQAFDYVVAELREIMINRRRKYGSMNITKHGEWGVAMRLSDKEARIHNSYFDAEDKPRPTPLDTMADESLNDTWADTSNYGIIALMLRYGLWGLPLEDSK